MQKEEKRTKNKGVGEEWPQSDQKASKTASNIGEFWDLSGASIGRKMFIPFDRFGGSRIFESVIREGIGMCALPVVLFLCSHGEWPVTGRQKDG